MPARHARRRTVHTGLRSFQRVHFFARELVDAASTPPWSLGRYRGISKKKTSCGTATPPWGLEHCLVNLIYEFCMCQCSRHVVARILFLFLYYMNINKAVLHDIWAPMKIICVNNELAFGEIMMFEWENQIPEKVQTRFTLGDPFIWRAGPTYCKIFIRENIFNIGLYL